MKQIFLIFTLLTANCSSQIQKMSHPDDGANYDTDYYECSYEAEKLIATHGSAYDNMMRPTRVNDKTKLCMKARGWSESD